MKKLRICMICSEFPPRCAGIGNNVYAISRALVRNGHKVTVLTRGHHFHESRRTVDGINVIELPFISLPPPLHLIYHGYFINKILNKIKNDFDILHLHSPLVPKIKISLPKIVSVQSLWLEETKYFKDSNDYYSLAVKLFEKQIIQSEKDTLKQANLICTYSKQEKKLLQMYNLNLPKINVISGIIQSNFVSTYKTKKEYDVIFVGRLNPRKGVKEIMKAAPLIAKKFPFIRFLIIGNGISRKWMEKEAEKIGLKNNFIFLGFVINKKIVRYFSESRIAIVPSRYEPFGIVTGEAMMCGLPVVGTRVGGTQNMIQDGITGYLINVGDYKSLANRVINLLIDDKKAIQMGQEGKKRISKYFNEDVIVRKFESVYREVLQNIK